jgi:hypothetical protein
VSAPTGLIAVTCHTHAEPGAGGRVYVPASEVWLRKMPLPGGLCTWHTFAICEDHYLSYLPTPEEYEELRGRGVDEIDTRFATLVIALTTPGIAEHDMADRALAEVINGVTLQAKVRRAYAERIGEVGLKNPPVVRALHALMTEATDRIAGRPQRAGGAG